MTALIATMSVFSFAEGIGVWQAILMIIGLVLLIVEVFTPGFGIAGGTGLVLLIVGILASARNPEEALIMFGILLVLVVVLLIIILRSAKKGRLRKLILHSASRSENGYSATADFSGLLGVEGEALTVLRPAGTAVFDGRRLDVVTEGGFIPAGSPVKIVRIEGRRIVVVKIG